MLALLAAMIATVLLLSTGSGPVAAAAAARHSAPAPCPQEFGSFSAGNWPSACWRPYGPTSPFNQPLPANPRVAPASAGIVADLAHYNYTFNGGSKFFLSSNGRDAVYYPRPSDPLVTIDCTYYYGPATCQGSNGVVINRRKIHLPAGAQPQDGVDRHMTVIDQANGAEYDFEHASLSGRTLTVWTGGVTRIGANLGTGLGVPSTAANLTTFGGLIRAPELAGGNINHALGISIPCTDGYVWPAQRANGLPCDQISQPAPSGDAAPPIGARFQLAMTDAQIAASGAPAWEQAIMTAMAHYGLYVNDTNGGGDNTSFEMETESDQSYTSVGGQPEMANLLRRLGASYFGPQSQWTAIGSPIPISALRMIDPCVARGTCPASAPIARTAQARLVRRCRALRARGTRGNRDRGRLPARCVRALRPHHTHRR